jgi:DNA polymerase II small subunit/DNA polymerase delta subunit B
LVSEIQGRAWFDIMPASHDANVMALPQAVAA